MTTLKCNACGGKFSGKLAEEHVPDSEDCHEWMRVRLERLMDWARDLH